MRPVYIFVFLTLMGLFMPGFSQAGNQGRTIRLKDAVSAAIVNATGVVLQEQTVEQKKGVLQQEKGAFDPRLTVDNSFEQSDTPFNNSNRHLYNKRFDKQQTISSSISLLKTLPEGPSFGPNITLGRTRDNLLYSTDNTSVMEFQVTIPLLKGRGRGSTGAALSAASVDLEASRLDLAHVAAQSVQQVAKSFWAALAAKEQLHIYRETEKDSLKLLANSKLMVEKNELPAIQLDTLTADVDARTAQRISQEQKLAAAKYQLALDMGVEALSMVDEFEVDGRFPGVGTDLAPVKDLLKFAGTSRNDLAAERRREKYYAVLVGKYKNELLPQVNFTSTVGYQGLSEKDAESGFFDSVGEDTSGLNYTVGLGLTYSFGNNAARGVLMQYQALLRKQHLTLVSLNRTIYADVLAQHSGVLSAARQVERQRDAVASYRKALEKKRLGLLHGMVTLTELLDLRDTYRDSRLSLVSMSALYADALIDLRLACGDLIKKEGTTLRVDPKHLRTPPTLSLPALPGRDTGGASTKRGDNG